MMRRPPGLSALRIPAHFNARSAGFENCVKISHTTSYAASGYSQLWTSASSKTTLTPCSRARARALSSAVGEKSIACTSSPCSASRRCYAPLRRQPPIPARRRQQRLAFGKKIVRRLTKDVVCRTETCFPTPIFLTQFCLSSLRKLNNISET